MFRFRKAFLACGWILTIAGLAYLAVGLRDLFGNTQVSWALLVTGLAGVVVGSSLIRWMRRTRPK